MQVVRIEQRTEQWHEFRANGIGGSEVAAIMGISPFQTPYGLYLEKSGRVGGKDLSRNPHVIRGIENEDRIAQIIAAHFGESGESICGIHDDYSFVRCSFDYVTHKAISEIKAPSDKQWEWVKENGPHPYYVVQAEYQAIVAETLDLESRLIYWRINEGKDELMVFPVILTQARRAEIIERVSDFWNRCIIDDVPPDLDPERDRIEINSPEWIEAAKRWVAYSLQVKDANEAVKAIKEKMQKEEAIFQRLADGFPLAEGGGIKYTRYFKRGNIDYKSAFATHAPEVTEDELNEFRKEGDFETKITVKKEKTEKTKAAKAKAA